MSKVKYVHLRDLCTVNQGLQIPIENRYAEPGPNRYFYITVQFLKEGHLEKYYIENPPISTICNEDDLIIVRTGSTGQVLTGIKGCFHNNFFKVNFNKNLLHHKYLYYCLTSKEKQKEMLKRSGITTIPDLNHFMFLDIKIPYQSIKEQQKIAAVLSALDDKIELNNKINAELEAMAKTLYDYWFVQFEFPNADGKPYKSSGGKMVYNPILKREIPEGWEVRSLFECAKVQYGFPFSTEYFNENGNGIPVIRIRDILNNSISNYSTQDNIDEKYSIKEGDLLIGMDGNFHINYWTRHNCYLNQRIVMLKETILPNILLRYQVEPYIQLREKSVSRTTVGHLSDKDLKAINILVPTEPVLNMIKSLFDSKLKKIIVNSKQNQELASLRDWLLPMLMNGQVKVEGVEKEEVSIAAGDSINFNYSRPTYNDDMKFEHWLQHQGLAARGDIDKDTLREIFDAMDDEDK